MRSWFAITIAFFLLPSPNKIWIVATCVNSARCYQETPGASSGAPTSGTARLPPASGLVRG